MYSRVSPKKWKLCDNGQMMGELILKSFYFYYFRFRFELAMLKNTNQKKTICACAAFFSWRKECHWKLYKKFLGKSAKRLQLLARGMNKINPTSLKISFAPGHGMFLGKRCILGHPTVHIFSLRIFLCNLIIKSSETY